MKKWDIVLDIWANIWFDSMLLSKEVGKSGKVYSFEPAKKTYQILHKNIYDINSFEKNIELNKQMSVIKSRKSKIICGYR